MAQPIGASLSRQSPSYDPFVPSPPRRPAGLSVAQTWAAAKRSRGVVQLHMETAAEMDVRTCGRSLICAESIGLRVVRDERLPSHPIDLVDLDELMHERIPHGRGE